MTVYVTKPAINLRETLADLDRDEGLVGLQILSSDTATEAVEALDLEDHTFVTFNSTGIDDNATSTKLTVSDTGIDVTGTVTARDLALNDGASSSAYFQDSTGTNGYQIRANVSSSSDFGLLIEDLSGSNIAQFQSNGDISFYEDTGTTPKFFWDASAESLGIGTSSPTNISGYAGLSLDGSTGGLITLADDGVEQGRIVAAASLLNIASSTASGAISVRTGGVGSGSERMRIDSSGNVGIGTSNPAQRLTVLQPSSAPTAWFQNTGSTEQTITLGDPATIANGCGLYGRTTGNFAFIHSGGNFVWKNTSGTEFARIDASGSLLVGKTSLEYTSEGVALRERGEAYITSDGRAPLLVNRLTSDGEIASFRKDGTTVGSIGSAAGARLYIGSGDTNLRMAGDLDTIVPWNGTNNTLRDAAIDLGESAGRFKDIYASNGTIQTSDRNEKQDIEALSDAEQRVAAACKGLLRKFRWKSSVEEKGDDARIHFGIIAQDLQDAFAAEGLDAGRYAMFISTTWTDEETGEERTRMGVRYSELLAFIIAAI